MAEQNDVLVVERTDGIATMRLNRPAQRNAMNFDMRRAIVRACRQLDSASDVSAVVLTGTDPAFSAGVDLREAVAGPRPPERTNPAQALRAMTKPVIAAVNGPCVTGALELALSCTFVIASDRATFADTHARVGLIPGWGLSALLPRAVGVRRAREMSATGNFVAAAEAATYGLVNRVVAHEALLPTAYALARDITGVDPVALARTLQLYDDGEGATMAHALGLEAEAVAAWRTERNRTSDLLDASIARGSSMQQRDRPDEPLV